MKKVSITLFSGLIALIILSIAGMYTNNYIITFKLYTLTFISSFALLFFFLGAILMKYKSNLQLFAMSKGVYVDVKKENTKKIS